MTRKINLDLTEKHRPTNKELKAKAKQMGELRYLNGDIILANRLYPIVVNAAIEKAISRSKSDLKIVVPKQKILIEINNSETIIISNGRKIDEQEMYKQLCDYRIPRGQYFKTSVINPKSKDNKQLSWGYAELITNSILNPELIRNIVNLGNLQDSLEQVEELHQANLPEESEITDIKVTLQDIVFNRSLYSCYVLTSRLNQIMHQMSWAKFERENALKQVL